MPEVIIRPTAKFLKLGWLIAILVVIAMEIAYFAFLRDNSALAVLAAVAPLLLLWPVAKWLRWRSTQVVLGDDRLRYQTGLLSKSTRTIHLAKLQDVRSDQKMFQRLWNIGDISLETAGEASRLTLPRVDDPERVADEIMKRAQNAGGL